ncbi:hypothetical protein DSO57_1005702 [Entomophthora muscae]|uniref:Uncharacterized protein n=1 Tax=Entomophthora muscae TaxID=34485 RepID=A0ACC2SKV1_9FUNG|nr:hypothetical protein DSO57_1005702 [Entomophthora muscae]
MGRFAHLGHLGHLAMITGLWLTRLGTCSKLKWLPDNETKNDGPNGEASQTKGIIAPNGGVIKAPNGGNKILTIRFMSLKSALVANKEPSPEEGTGLWPDPMTTTLEQDNQVANLRYLTNERTPCLGTILLPLNPSTQIPPGPLFPMP